MVCNNMNEFQSHLDCGGGYTNIYIYSDKTTELNTQACKLEQGNKSTEQWLHQVTVLVVY